MNEQPASARAAIRGVSLDKMARIFFSCSCLYYIRSIADATNAPAG
jgi:hypothetical protein